MTNTSTKLSGLEINAEYSFQLILRTTAGVFPSNLIRVRTHTMTDTSGICVCFGNVQDPALLEDAKLALREMKARWSDKIQIDTTHFVCTTPAPTPTGAQAAGNSGGPPGIEYQRALQLSIPVVQPHWILACHSEKKMIPIASYYLGAAPSTPVGSAGLSNRPQSMSQASLSHPPTTPQLPNKQTLPSYRASMPAPARQATATPPNQASAFVNQPTSARQLESTTEEPGDEAEADRLKLERTTSAESKRKSRSGTMNREFKFPPTSSSPPAMPEVPAKKGPPAPLTENGLAAESLVTPSSIEVPPPPPVEKERSFSNISLESGEDDVGDTVDIPLN